MIHRFQRQSSAAHGSQKGLVCASDCLCCRALQNAREAALYDALPEWGSPLTPGVQLVNLSHSLDERSLRVDLSHEWMRMFQQLPLVGEGLVMTRNIAAILGRRMVYPDVEFTADGSKGACGVKGLWLDVRKFGGARAVHMRRQSGHLFGVEFANAEGHLVHRFTLTGDSELDEFFAWVRLHQACEAQKPMHWKDAESDDMAGEPLVNTHRESEGGAISSVLAGCVKHALPVSITVCAGAARQRGEFIPEALQQLDEWWFLSDEENGLHFQSELLPRVLVEEWRESDGKLCRRMRCVMADDTTGLLIESGAPETESDWQSLLETLV